MKCFEQRWDGWQFRACTKEPNELRGTGDGSGDARSGANRKVANPRQGGGVHSDDSAGRCDYFLSHRSLANSALNLSGLDCQEVLYRQSEIPCQLYTHRLADGFLAV